MDDLIVFVLISFAFQFERLEVLFFNGKVALFARKKCLPHVRVKFIVCEFVPFSPPAYACPGWMVCDYLGGL